MSIHNLYVNLYVNLQWLEIEADREWYRKLNISSNLFIIININEPVEKMVDVPQLHHYSY